MFVLLLPALLFPLWDVLIWAFEKYGIDRLPNGLVVVLQAGFMVGVIFAPAATVLGGSLVVILTARRGVRDRSVWLAWALLLLASVVVVHIDRVHPLR